MRGTRQSLADKLAALETQVTQKFASATDAVQETVQGIRGAVEETVGTVKDTVQGVRGGVQSLLGSSDESTGTGSGVHGLVGGVQGLVGGVQGLQSGIQDTIHSLADDAKAGIKEAFDVAPFVRENPWQAVGLAAGAGLVAGLVFGPSKHGSSGGLGGAVQGFVGGAPGRPGVFDELFKMVGQEVRKIGETAIHSLSKSVNQTVTDRVPKLVDTAVTRFTDGAAGNGHAAADDAADLSGAGRHRG